MNSEPEYPHAEAVSRIAARLLVAHCQSQGRSVLQTHPSDIELAVRIASQLMELAERPQRP